MASVIERDDHEEIRRLLSKINEAWLRGHTQELNNCFHDDVVVKGPEFQEMARGREACVRSYEDFIRLATVREFKAPQPVVDVFGSMAVAVGPWEISYTTSDKDYHESGHDLMILTREEGKWQVVWRAVLPSRQS